MTEELHPQQEQAAAASSSSVANDELLGERHHGSSVSSLRQKLLDAYDDNEAGKMLLQEGERRDGDRKRRWVTETKASSSSSGGDAMMGDEIRDLDITDEERVMMRQFRMEDWLKVIEGMDDWKERVAKVGSEMLRRVKDAEETQYETSEFKEESAETAAAGDMTSGSGVVSITDSTGFGVKIAHMARWTPIRLAYEERSILRLLESCLYISEYTDKVDVLMSGSNRARVIASQIRRICSILTGLVVARDYEEGKRLLKDRDFKQHAPFFQAVFEIGRRYKLLNPETMRDYYGKLMYFLMDSSQSDISNILEFNCVIPVHTVLEFAKTKVNGETLLADPLLKYATEEIYTDGKTQRQVHAETMRKNEAVKKLIAKYSTSRNEKTRSRSHIFGFRSSFWPFNGSSEDEEEAPNKLEVTRKSQWERTEMTGDDVEAIVYSLSDHFNFLRFNQMPCDKMIGYLKAFFNPNEPEEHFSLAVVAGRGGARLTHPHQRQYQYVLQSLMLWREILKNFLQLWHLADLDMCSSGYSLRDTGQGLNRIQRAPRIQTAMQQIINTVHKEVGTWVGSSVVHLGDRNVPNALMFIDKYTQVPRILNPIILVIEQIPVLYKSSEEVTILVDRMYGGIRNLIKYILADFFRHAFDGSGGDNFFDAGSCIDGRLTSAWNWCSQIEKKRYFPILLICRFIGFDGKF